MRCVMTRIAVEKSWIGKRDKFSVPYLVNFLVPVTYWVIAAGQEGIGDGGSDSISEACCPPVVAQPRLHGDGYTYPCAFYRGQYRNLFGCKRPPAEESSLPSSRAHGDNLCP